MHPSSFHPPRQRDETDALEPVRAGSLASFLGPTVRVLWNVLSARMVSALAPFGLRSGAFSTMSLISERPGCSQNELSRALGIDKSALVALLDELETNGLARRVRSTSDRRRHALTLTSEGEALMARMREPVAAVGQPIREALTPAEMDQLLRLLERAHRALVESPPPESS